MAQLTDITAESQPFDVLKKWLSEAKNCPTIKEPLAMTLATTGADGIPSQRVVLLKELKNESLLFYTNYQSQKGRELAVNPNASINFFWDPLFKQIRITGSVSKTSRADSEAYWNSRPRGSQLSQWISHQSEAVDSRQRLEAEYAAAEDKFKNSSVPCPAHWGGYALSPFLIEFWVGQPNRLHDRYEFRRLQPNAPWTFRRLFP